MGGYNNTPIKIKYRHLLVICLTLTLSGLAFAEPNEDARVKQRVTDVFSQQYQVQRLLEIEAALARIQADLGIIPDWAAEELTKKAQVSYVPLDQLAAEQTRVQHSMVSLLNIWQLSIEGGAEEYMHFGATTVDIFNTALMLQLHDASALLLEQLRQLENIMIRLAEEHKATPMMGRTLGQHALPITFGKKVSTWLGENRRNIERLKIVRSQIAQSSIMKGAVGSYLGLGEQGMEIERGVARELGLGTPILSDWNAARDVLADYALTLALISKSYGRIGNELFLLTMTDIGETEEILPKTVVGSSTMPHKKNPKMPDKLIQYSRLIPRLAEVVLEDVVNSFERDESGGTRVIIEEITIETASMLDDATYLLSNLRVKTEVMKVNLSKTRGLIMTQRVTFALADKIGKTTANTRMHEVALLALRANISLREAIDRTPDIAQHFSGEQLDQLLDATTYLGLAVKQVDAVIAYCREQQHAEKQMPPI